MPEVVELLDGPLGRDADGVIGEAAAAALAVLERTSVADVVEGEAREAGVAMYHIQARPVNAATYRITSLPGKKRLRRCEAESSL